MREFYGPGFLEALAPQLLSRKIWVVVIPCGLADPMKPLKLELAFYSSLQDAQPRNVIALWKANVDEIRLHQSDPVLTIFDMSSNSRYKFTSVSDSEEQQLQLLHRACITATEVLPTHLRQSNQTIVPESSTKTSEEARGSAIGINASIDSAKDNKTLDHYGQSSGVKSENDWCNTTDNSTHNGWGSLVTSGITTHGWRDDQTKVEENGWGSAAGVPSQRQQSPLPRSTSSELSCRGWINEPAIEEYNGWAVPYPRQEYNDWAVPQPRQGLEGRRDASAEVNCQGWGETAKDSALPSISKMAMSGVGSCVGMHKTDTEEYDQRHALENRSINHPAESITVREGNPAFDFVAPSAPPVPEDVVDEEAVHYPKVDLSPLDLPNPLVEQAASLTTEKENEHEPALCIICWESSVEGACVPCGHMVGCMQCLTQIKSAKGECPVCRVKIDQVIKLYSV